MPGNLDKHETKSKIQKKVIKHAPLRPYVHTELDTTVYVKSKTPFVSAVKRIEKMISKFDMIPNKRGKFVRKGNISGSCNYIVVKGMGKSIGKAINIGLHFKFQENFCVDIFTKTVGVLDELVDQDDDGASEDSGRQDTVLQKRNVGAVEIRIYV